MFSMKIDDNLFSLSSKIKGDCDFDDDTFPFCNWKNVKIQTAFIRQKGKTPTSGTGPSRDKTQNGSKLIANFFISILCLCK